MGTVSLATHTGITVHYLEMIEAGTKTPSLPVLRRLAERVNAAWHVWFTSPSRYTDVLRGLPGLIAG